MSTLTEKVCTLSFGWYQEKIQNYELPEAKENYALQHWRRNFKTRYDFQTPAHYKNFTKQNDPCQLYNHCGHVAI